MAMSEPATDKQIQVLYSAYINHLFYCVRNEKREGDYGKAEKVRFLLSSNAYRKAFFERARKHTRSELSAMIVDLHDTKKVIGQILFSWILAQIEDKYPGSIIWIDKYMRI